jgi:hypothetical protein
MRLGADGSVAASDGAGVDAVPAFAPEAAAPAFAVFGAVEVDKAGG